MQSQSQDASTILEALRRGEARNAADPHGAREHAREQELGEAPDQRQAFVVCGCGRRFEARTFALAMSSHRRHHEAASR